MASKGESGLQGGDWAEDEEQETFGMNVEVVEDDVNSQISTAAPKQTGNNVWAEVPVSTSQPVKPAKSEPYRPGAQLKKKQVDSYFPALGTAAPAETPQEQQPKDTSNRFAELQEEAQPVAKPAASEPPKGKKKKKKDEWKTVDLNAKVAITEAEKDLVLQDEANKMYEPKIVKQYARQERRSDFPSSGEPDTTWRKAGDAAAPSEPRPAPFSVRRDEPIKRSEDLPPRRDEPFRRGEDAPVRRDEPFRRGEEAPPRREEPFRRGEEATFPRSEAPPKTDLGAWRSAASQQTPPAAAPVETERKEVARPKFTNTKKKTESTEEPREDEWKAADKQAQEKPKVNMWEKGDPQI